MTRYKPEHREQTHDAILAAASEILRERGFEGTGVAEVMKAVGLTHGGFYAHFSNKDALLVAALERAFVESPINFAKLAMLANKTGDVGVMAEKYLGDERVADVASTCPSAALVSEMHRQPEAVQSVFKQGSQATARAIAGVPGLAPDGAEEAWAVLAMFIGALSLMRAMPEKSTRTKIRSQVAGTLRRLASGHVSPTKETAK